MPQSIQDSLNAIAGTTGLDSQGAALAIATSVASSHGTYTIQFGGTIASGSPSIADSATFYIGGPGMGTSLTACSGLTTVDGYYVPIVPITGTVVGYAFRLDTPSANAASNEAATLSLRVATTDTELATDVIFSASSGTGYAKTGTTSIAVTAGQKISFKVVCPAFATNPANAYFFFGSVIVRY